MDSQKSKHKPLRLSQFDYSTPGAYFITICAHNSAEIFSSVLRLSELEAPAVELTACGKVIEKNIHDISKRFPNFTVDNYAIMPNHIHLLLTVAEPIDTVKSKTVSDVVGAFKSITAVQCLKELGVKNLWQHSFYDHIVRDDKDYYEIAKYIEFNAEKWLQSH